MPISVKDIQEKEFSRQKRDGYNIEEVDDFLDEISDQLSVLIRENMALAEQVKTLQTENEKLEASASAPAPAEQSQSPCPSAPGRDHCQQHEPTTSRATSKKPPADAARHADQRPAHRRRDRGRGPQEGAGSHHRR